MSDNRYSKVITAVVFLASVAAPLNQFKVPPMMGQLMESLNISMATSGWLMSVFALVGVIFALPAGLTLKRLGLKATALAALAALLLGSAIGYLSQNAALMLFSRVIEGTGMCLLSVMAPAAIAAWFPPEKRGLPMGIWASWVPMGSILMFNIAPLIGVWKSVWLFAIGYTALTFILTLVLFRLPREGEVASVKAEGRAVYGNPYAKLHIWLLGALFLLFNIMVLSINTFMPIFLETVRNFPTAQASSFASILMIAALIMGPITGILINRLGSCKKLFVSGMLIAAISMAFIFSATGGGLILVLIIVGITFGLVPTSVFAAAPEIMKNPADAGIGMSIVAFGQNIGMFAGPALIGWIAGSSGWQLAAYALIPILTAGFIIGLIIKVR
jgi:MFS family permease